MKYFQLDLVHLGAKYGPCMRWDETIDRQIQDDRNKVELKTNTEYKYNTVLQYISGKVQTLKTRFTFLAILQNLEH